MQLTTDQIITIGQWAITLIVLAVLFYIQYRSNQNVVASLTETLKAFQNSPVAIENAKAAGANIPQKTFEDAYRIMDGFIGLIGKTTPVGQLATEIKETAELIDHDPANDPVPGNG